VQTDTQQIRRKRSTAGSFDDRYRRLESAARRRSELVGRYARTCYEAGADFEASRRAREAFDETHARLLRAEDRALEDLRVTDTDARPKGF
jgi:hypothetical protein